MDIRKFEVPVEKLRWQCDPAVFDFECTKELAPLREFIGQDRAIRAIQFGLSMNHEGYNVFVAGLTGTGKTSMVKTYIDRLIAKHQIGDNFRPQDWAYVYNFTDPDHPQAITMLQGTCKDFRNRISNLLDRLKEDLARAFSSDEYKNSRKKVIEESQANQQKLMQEIGEDAQKQGFSLEVTQVGPVLVPLIEGRPMNQTEYMALDEKIRKELDKRHAELLKEVQETFEKLHELQHQTVQKLADTDKALADITVTRLFDGLLTDYKDQPKIIQYLNDLKKFTLDNLDIFKVEEVKAPTMFGLPSTQITQGRDPYLPFQINVFIDNSETQGPPVITEPNPIYPNLFGKLERRFLLGGYLSDHTMLKPGAIHRANGGYLLLSAAEVITNIGV